MTERPILFSGPMIRAILDGIKTQTRRVVNPQPDHPQFSKRHMLTTDDEGADLYLHSPTMARAIRCPYGRPGANLWARETWARDDEDGALMYRADLGRDSNADAWEQGRRDGVPRYRWRPSIHMPRWASRITLEVVSVRVERLQDISEADALAEGITKPAGSQFWHGDPRGSSLPGETPQWAYRNLWESINGPGSWDANPWVWVVEFRRVETIR